MTPSADPSTLGRKVELLYRNVLLGQVVSIINASALTWVAITQKESPLVYAWWLAAVAIAAFRVLLAARHNAKNEAARQAGLLRWRRYALLGAASAGMVWASGALLLMYHDNTQLQLFTAFVMAGMVAGAVPILAADRTAFRAYAWPIVLTVAIASLGDDALHIAFAAMSLLFLVVVTRSADRFHDTLHETFHLEHEKDGLLVNLEKSRALAERSDRAKTEFLANISHELRTPMNGILGLSELLSLEPLSAEQKSLLDPLRDSANQLMQQIEHLIQLSALEAGHVKLQPAPFALNELLDSLLSTQREIADAKRLEMLQWTDPELPDVLIGDLYHLQQVFQHLIGNAVKFTDRGSVGVRARLLERDKGSARIEFCIVDTGPGISPEQRQLIDNMLSQIDGSSVRRFGGLGIGLPIARRLVDLMGGKLDIDSELGKGSTFRFVLPFSLPDPDEEQAEADR